MLVLYKPVIDDLWFRKKLLADPDTMAYNQRWGGTINFDEDKWEPWYQKWLNADESSYFYRYLRNEENDSFVGEIAFHSDEGLEICLADVIIHAQYRKKGYGTQGLKLLCEAAREKGISVLYDEIAADNPAIGLFRKQGFVEESRTAETVLLKKEL